MEQNKYFEGCYVTEQRWLAYCKDGRRLRFRGLAVQIILPNDTVITPEEYWKSKEKKKGRWKPEVGQYYYSLNHNGEISIHLFNGWSKFATFQFETNNMFETSEEAEEHKKKLIYQQQYRDYAMEHNDEIDWNNTKQFKYCVFYAHEANTIVCDAYWSAQPQGAVYFTNKQDILDFIRLIGEDNFRKYILEVE